ncbi:MAG: FeoB-associated Cys-rich membrane protein [Flavobacteriaceae bacterium]
MGVQEFIVLAVLAAAVIYLVLRFTKKKTGCGDDCNCH